MDELDIDWDDTERFAKYLSSSFEQSGITIGPVRSSSEIQKEATERSHAIHAAYRTLHGIVERHEQTIQARWMKKPKQKRLNILLDAWPGMAPSIHPDWDKAIQLTEMRRRQDPKYRDGYLWPYINQEAMLKPKSLLLLLQARAWHHPTNFAAGDIASINFAIASYAILPVVEEGPEFSFMVLNGATEPETYGRLVPYGNEDEYHIDPRFGNVAGQFSLGEGLLILEIQERLLNFIVACCRGILHDISGDDLTSERFPVQRPLLHLKADSEADGVTSLAVMAEEAPYRVPAHADFARVEIILGARATAARDHIWAMREDPAYFADHIAEALDHRQEGLRDTLNQRHPLFCKGNEDLVRSLAIRDIIGYV